MHCEVVTTCTVTGVGDTVGKHLDLPERPRQRVQCA